MGRWAPRRKRRNRSARGYTMSAHGPTMGGAQTMCGGPLARLRQAEAGTRGDVRIRGIRQTQHRNGMEVIVPSVGRAEGPHPCEPRERPAGPVARPPLRDPPPGSTEAWRGSAFLLVERLAGSGGAANAEHKAHRGDGMLLELLLAETATVRTPRPSVAGRACYEKSSWTRMAPASLGLVANEIAGDWDAKRGHRLGWSPISAGITRRIVPAGGSV